MKSTVVGLRRQGYKVRVLDCMSHSEMAQDFGVRSIPCFVYEKDGQLVRKKKGRLTEDQMKALCSDGWW